MLLKIEEIKTASLEIRVGLYRNEDGNRPSFNTLVKKNDQFEKDLEMIEKRGKCKRISAMVFSVTVWAAIFCIYIVSFVLKHSMLRDDDLS